MAATISTTCSARSVCMLFFNELVRLIWGPAGLSLSLPMWLILPVEMLPGLYYPPYRIAIILTALLVALFLYILVMRTRLGMLIRAGRLQPRDDGRAGRQYQALYTLVFGLGAALADSPG